MATSIRGTLGPHRNIPRSISIHGAFSPREEKNASIDQNLMNFDNKLRLQFHFLFFVILFPRNPKSLTENNKIRISFGELFFFQVHSFENGGTVAPAIFSASSNKLWRKKWLFVVQLEGIDGHFAPNAFLWNRSNVESTKYWIRNRWFEYTFREADELLTRKRPTSTQENPLWRSFDDRIGIWELYWEWRRFYLLRSTVIRWYKNRIANRAAKANSKFGWFVSILKKKSLSSCWKLFPKPFNRNIGKVRNSIFNVCAGIPDFSIIH